MIPKYLRLKEQISEDILQKKFPLYGKLPTENEMAQLYGVSRATVRSALELLSEEGIIEKKWGSGNVVVATGQSNHKKDVALLVPDKSLGWCDELIHDLTELTFKDGLTLSVFETGFSLAREREALTRLLSDTYRGVLAYPVNTAIPNCNYDLYLKLLRRQVPVIFLYNALPQIYNPSVAGADDYRTGYQLGKNLITYGEKDYSIIFSGTTLEGHNCFSGFMDAFRDSNLPLPDDCTSFDFSNKIKMAVLHKENSHDEIGLSKSLGREALKLLLTAKTGTGV